MSQLRIYSPIEQVKKSAIGETIFPPDKNFLIPQLRKDRGSKYKYEYKYKYRYKYKYKYKNFLDPAVESKYRQPTVLTVPVNSNS